MGNHLDLSVIPDWHNAVTFGLTGFESLSRSEAGGGRLAQGWSRRAAFARVRCQLAEPRRVFRGGIWYENIPIYYYFIARVGAIAVGPRQECALAAR